MKMTRRGLGVIAAAMVLLAAAGGTPATAQTVEEIKARGTLNVGMLVDFPPFGILDLQGQPDGYDADVAKLLAKDMGVALNIVPVTGPNRIPYLLSGQADLLVASLGITPERAEQVDFTIPYAGIENFLYAPVETEISGPEDLSGKSIGVARASTQDTTVTRIAPPDTNIQRFDDDASTVQALLSGQVDGIGLSGTVIPEIEKSTPGRFEPKFSLIRQHQGIAIRKGADDLRAYVNDFLKRSRENGSLEAISQKWLTVALPDFVGVDPQ